LGSLAASEAMQALPLSAAALVQAATKIAPATSPAPPAV